jgi:hypothetical protein
VWREWLAAVLRQHEVIDEHARTLGTPDAQGPMLEKARAAAMVLRTPCSFCPGPDSLRARLNELWDDYAPAGEDWKRQISPVQRLHGPRRQQRALWNALTPFHGRLAPLTVYLVEYLEPVVMPVPHESRSTKPIAAGPSLTNGI